MITIEKARRLRQMILKAATSLTDDDAYSVPELFPRWKTATAYAMHARVDYGDKLYKCVQAHTSQSDWTPDITPNMWTEVPTPGTIPVWRQPTGAQDAYMIGDKVHYPTAEDPVYICTMDYNIYAPGVAGWDLFVG